MGIDTRMDIGIDWTDSKSKVTSHFTVGDMLFLHKWNRLGNMGDGASFTVLETWAQKLEEIRVLLGCPMNVHCTYRPPEYNKEIGAPANDAHSQCLATDFDCGSNLTIQQVKDILEPKLEYLGIRMERGTTTWVHVDGLPVKHARYFYP